MQRATATHSLLLTCRRLWSPVFVFSAVSLSVCLSVCLRVCVRGSAAHTSPVTSLRLSIKYRGERCLWCPTAGSMAGPGLVGAESRTYIMRVHSGLTVAVLDGGLFDGPLSD